MEIILSKFKNGLKIKNALSNVYLYLEEIKSSDAKNIYQVGANLNPKNAIWKFRNACNDYAFITSLTDQGKILYLTCTEDNNIEPRNFTGADNQKFYIQYKEKGHYFIKSKISKNKFCIELKGNKVGINDKVKQGPLNDSLEQKWIFEAIENVNKETKLKSANLNKNENEKKEKVVKTVIYTDKELVHTIVFVK